MNLVDRVKNILMTPKTEWLVIENEPATPMSLLTGYIFPLVIISVIGTVLQGLFFAGYIGIAFFIAQAVIKLIAAVVGFYLSSYVIDMLAPNFKSEKDLNKSAQLVAYSYTPSLVAGLLSFIPILGGLILLAGGVYSIYLMYLGIGPLKKTAEDQKVVYMIISFLVMAVIYFVVLMILGLIVAVIGFGAVAATGSLRY